MNVSPISTQDPWSSARVTTKVLVLVVPNPFHLGIMEATLLFGIFNAAKVFIVAFPKPVPQQRPVFVLCKQALCLMAWFLP